MRALPRMLRACVSVCVYLTVPPCCPRRPARPEPEPDPAAAAAPGTCWRCRGSKVRVTPGKSSAKVRQQLRERTEVVFGAPSAACCSPQPAQGASELGLRSSTTDTPTPAPTPSPTAPPLFPRPEPEREGGSSAPPCGQDENCTESLQQQQAEILLQKKPEKQQNSKTAGPQFRMDICPLCPSQTSPCVLCPPQQPVPVEPV